MATNKRKQDEKHLKMLREMVALPHNKQCYDCHQRGPTYVNMTIGSFVCTSCSGILRGLNPPHRVKSISMTSFTPDEMEFLRCHGNDFCKKVWLGLYDSRSMLEPDSKDENKIKDFMIQKYEKKRWYVAPTEQMKEDARKQNTPAKAPETKPLKTLVGNNVPRLVIQNHQSTSQPAQKAASQPGPIQAPAAQAPAASQASAAPAQAQQPKKSSAFDLLGDLGGDPFASPAPAAQAPPGGGFADFTSFNSQGPPAAQPATQPAFPTPAAAPGGGGFLQPLGTSQQASSAAPAPSSTGAFGAFTSSTPAAPPASVQGMSASDKYAALADLDSVFGTTSGGQNVNWNSSGFGGGMSTATSMSNRGPTTSATTQANAFAGTAANPFGGSGMAQTQTSTAVGNPFIGGSTVGQPGFGQPGFPPPGGNVGQYGNVPQPAAGGGGAGTGGFGQFGAQPVASSAGFGQFGTNSTTSMATGQFGMQNGNFGTTALATGGWGAPGQAGFGPQPGQPQMVGAFGQPAAQPNMGFGGAAMTGVAANQFAKPVVGQPGFGAQPQQPYGAWPSQQPAGNPFMSAGQQQAAPPRGSSTNPFL